jgi:sortase A
MADPDLPAPETPPGAVAAPGGLVSEATAPALRRRRFLWVERGLLLVALVCLGVWAYAALDARLFQAWQEHRLEQELAEAPAGQGPAVLPGDEGAAYPRASAPPAGIEPGEPIGRIEIPRLGVSVIVAEGVAYRTLRRAVGHIPGTALPGAAGNVGIAGHRDSFFRPLKDIQTGDEVVLTTAWGTWRYVVDSTDIVRPSDTAVLDATSRPTLTLVTCYPFYYVGSAPKRFIVQAREVAAGTPAG